MMSCVMVTTLKGIQQFEIQAAICHAKHLYLLGRVNSEEGRVIGIPILRVSKTTNSELCVSLE